MYCRYSTFYNKPVTDGSVHLCTGVRQREDRTTVQNYSSTVVHDSSATLNNVQYRTPKGAGLVDDYIPQARRCTAYVPNAMYCFGFVSGGYIDDTVLLSRIRWHEDSSQQSQAMIGWGGSFGG